MYLLENTRLTLALKIQELAPVHDSTELNPRIEKPGSQWQPGYFIPYFQYSRLREMIGHPIQGTQRQEEGQPS